jgi:serine/threonine protein kinase
LKDNRRDVKQEPEKRPKEGMTKLKYYWAQVCKRRSIERHQIQPNKKYLIFKDAAEKHTEKMTVEKIKSKLMSHTRHIGQPLIKFDDYDIQITEHLGTGGFGLVWRCRAYKYDDLCAEKLLNEHERLLGDRLGFFELVIKAPHLGKTSEEYIEALCNEIAVLRHLNHDNLVRFVGCRFFNKFNGIMMLTTSADLTLEDLFRKNLKQSDGVDVETSDECPLEIAKIFYQLAIAMEYLHSPSKKIRIKDKYGRSKKVLINEVLHRDLKCGNVFLNVYDGLDKSEDCLQPKRWRVKLGDFGMAYSEQVSYDKKLPTMPGGTLEWY